MDFFATWINPIYAVATWVVVFILVKPRRIKELLPVGMIAGMILFAVQFILINLGLLQFNKGWMLVSGVPLLNPLWGVAAGILLMNFMKEEFMKKIPILLLFAVIVETAALLAIKAGNMSFLGKYNTLFDFIINLVMLLLLTQLSEGLYGKRIYQNKL